MTDSTIAPPPKKKTAIFFNEHFAAARHKERCYENNIFIPGTSYIFFVREGLLPLVPSTGDVGVARGTVFHQNRRFRSKKKSGGGGYRRTTLMKD